MIRNKRAIFLSIFGIGSTSTGEILPNNLQTSDKKQHWIVYRFRMVYNYKFWSRSHMA